MTSLELDLTAIIDELAERIVTEVTHRLAERLFGPPQPTAAPEPEPAPVPSTPPAPTHTRKQRVEGETHTCEICSREGTRRYVQTATGWRCGPTATACIGNQPEPVLKVPNPALATDLDAPRPAPRPATPSITAHCQDCTRTWNLTGPILQAAIDTHELKHGHIVDTYKEATA